MIIKNVQFNINDISEIMYHADSELSVLMSMVEDYSADEGGVPEAVNNWTVYRLLEVVQLLEDLNCRFLDIKKTAKEIKGGV